MVIITSTYLKPLTVIDALLADHRKFLVECHSQSKFIYSGSQSPRIGEAIVATRACSGRTKAQPISLTDVRSGQVWDEPLFILERILGEELGSPMKSVLYRRCKVIL